jgi:hypothetical protein
VVDGFKICSKLEGFLEKSPSSWVGDVSNREEATDASINLVRGKGCGLSYLRLEHLARVARPILNKIMTSEDMKTSI